MHRNEKYGYHKVTDITMRRGRCSAGAASGKRVPAAASPPSSAKGPGGMVAWSCVAARRRAWRGRKEAEDERSTGTEHELRRRRTRDKRSIQTECRRRHAC